MHLHGQGEGASPGGDLLLEAVDLINGAGSDLGLEVLELVGLLGQLTLDLLAELDADVDVVGNLGEVLLAETTRGHGGGTNTDTHGGEGRLVTRGGVLVAGNVDLLEDGLDTGTVQSEGLQVEQNHVVVGTTGDEGVAELLEGDLERLSVLDDLLLVLLELVGLSLLEGNSQSGDGVVVGTTLVTREDGEVDGTLKVVEDLLAGLSVGLADALAEEDHGTTGATERLVGGGGNDIGVGEGRGVDTGGDETRDVGHVHHQVAANLVGDLTHALVVDLAAVGRGTGDEDLRAVHESVLLELVVVDQAGLNVDTVREGLEVGRDGRDPSGWISMLKFTHEWRIDLLLLGSLVAVGQVTTVRKVKTHQPVVRPHDGLVDLEIGRAAGQALDVDAPLLRVETEGLESAPLAGELNLVDVLVATVVAGTRVALRVLVGHGRAKGIEDGAGGNILGGDEEDGLALALDLLFLRIVRGLHRGIE